MPFFMDVAFVSFKQRLSIDSIIEELTYAFIALFTYLFMQNSGRIESLKCFGILIGLALIAALVYNLYKAVFKSLAPGVICMGVGLLLLTTNLHQHYFKFLTNSAIDYMIGVGGFFVALSLFKSEIN